MNTIDTRNITVAAKAVLEFCEQLRWWDNFDRTKEWLEECDVIVTMGKELDENDSMLTSD